MKPSRPALLAALFAAVCCSASAQSVRPGLWEMTSHTMSGDGQMSQAMAEAQKQFANMPPAQRQMLQDMMAKNGIKVSPGGDSVNIQYCLTKDMIDRREFPTGQQGDCRTTTTPTTGGWNVNFTCNNPPSSGTGVVQMQGDSAYTMTTNATTTAGPGGKPEKLTFKSSGKLVSANCADKGK